MAHVQALDLLQGFGALAPANFERLPLYSSLYSTKMLAMGILDVEDFN
jgi:hypothetical protein